jgi:nondiscriminating aspartyl-tRNA synthetase
MEYKYHDIRSLPEPSNSNTSDSKSSDQVNNLVWMQGRVQKIRMINKNVAFVILRYQKSIIQTVVIRKIVGDDNFSKLNSITPESVVNLYGKLNVSPFEIKGATYKNMELSVDKYTIESLASPLPFGLEDADNFGDTFRSDVGQDLRLNNRWLDLRTPTFNSIFKLQSSIVNYFRTFLLDNNFIEIHSPKIISTASESGASVFKLDYFGKEGFLAQSPQLYKQMAINSDFDRVFEIGSIFRAEKTFTSRHLCEYIGLDLEMTIRPDKNYHEILHLMWKLLKYIVTSIYENNTEELEYIRTKLPFVDVVIPDEVLIIDFCDGVDMLLESGLEQGKMEDLNTVNEKALGELVKLKYGSDLFILDKYPSIARPFYTMPHSDDPNYSCSYDVIFRGQEISSGAQRINDHKLLLEKVIKHNINPYSMKEYIESFSHGSKRHGGCGFGLERILMLLLNLDNIRKASFCPRDPKRIVP